MFSIPDAKRVRRNDLYNSRSQSPDTDGQDDAVTDAYLQAQLAALYGPIETDSGVVEEAGEEQKPDAEQEPTPPAATENEFEFRLFSSAATSGPTPKIMLPDIPPPPATQFLLPGSGNSGEAGSFAGFVVPSRDPSYYFAAPPDGEKKRRYDLMAVTGEQVRSAARQIYQGWEMPWRVMSIRLDRAQLRKLGELHHHHHHHHHAGMTRIEGRDTQGSDEEDGDEDGESKDIPARRKRPGKKRRIMLRAKERAKVQKIEARKIEALAKEEQFRDKRTRKNRAQKLRAKRKKEEKKKDAANPAGHSTNYGNISEKFEDTRLD